MRVLRWLTAAALLVSGGSGALGADRSLPMLWFDQPAEKWTDALPIGNGRLGAMVFGGVPDERIQFNEDTLWKGQPHDYVRAGAREHLAQIRQLLFEGKIKEAEGVAKTNFLSDPIRQKAYQPFGDLHFHFIEITNVTGYRRELNLDSAVARVTYQSDGVTYQRDAFASFPDQVVVLHFTADQPGHISFTLAMDSPQTNSRTRAISSDTLALTGQVETGGLRFESRVRVATDGGQTSTNGNILLVKDANSATVFLGAATSFKNFQDISADPEQRCNTAMTQAAKHGYEDLLRRHLADYQKLFQRMNLDLGHTDRADLPSDRRQELVKSSGLDGDPA